jgi:arylformamidase
MSDWIDISLPVYSGMVVWPGDSEVHVQRVMELEKGDPFNLTQCSFTAHTGTHMDAPRHFLHQGAAIDTLPLDAVLGSCRVVQIRDQHAVRTTELPKDLEPGDRILFKTDNSLKYNSLHKFIEDFVYVSKEAASALVAANVRTVGIDYLSVGGFRNDMAETHLILLQAGVWIIEGLDLSKVEPGRYELACLPLRLVGADGAPARAALRRL